jgi:hypothetical protein
MSLNLPSSLTSSLLALALAPLAGAQDPNPGRFTNFETPQTHPIDIATVDDVDYVLVCNTPNNAVEIFEAISPHDRVGSIRVGLGPATVRWNADLGRFFTCNFDGDSVSVVRLVGGSASPSNPILERTTWVGDEASDLAFAPDTVPDPENDAVLQNLYVTLSSSSQFALVEGRFFDAGGCEFTAVDAALLEDTVTSTEDGDPLLLAVKTPRQIVVDGEGVGYVANLRAGSPAAGEPYDVAIYRFEPEAADIAGSASVLGGLGSTIHAFAMRADGERMFVVGTKAMNNVLPTGTETGLENVRDHVTGFVQSWLWVVDVSSTGAMTLRPEQTPVTNSALFRSINLNRDYSQSTLTEIDPDDALVQPTDVLVIHTSLGQVQRIVLTSYHSDRVAVLQLANWLPGGYLINRVDLPVRSTGSYSVVGPRGLAHSEATGLVYINGRLDNSLHVLDPFTGALTSLTLEADPVDDPTPELIREGREFLYSNRFSSGFVSCASCHVDGRTDSLAWDLSESVPGGEIAPEFHDGEIDGDDMQQEEFAPNKGRMVTQTLQGLINYPLNEEAQFASTNAPYYWRGQRRGEDVPGQPFEELNTSFDSFNEAFVKLQEMADPDEDGNGISTEDMVKYRRFVNTIMYPPNPEQVDDIGAPTRRTAGAFDATLANGANPLPSTSLSGARFGMALYHNVTSVPGTLTRSCVDCHHLPDGSSSTATLIFPAAVDHPTFGVVEGDDQTFESSGLRNLTPREMWLHGDFGTTPTHLTGNTALLHSGTRLFDNQIANGRPTSGVAGAGAHSINRFNTSFFGAIMPGTATWQDILQINGITQFVRQLDTGIAPAVGFPYTVDPGDSSLNNAWLALLEGQVADANIGLGVYVRSSGVVAHYWYDLTVEGYRKQGTATVVDRATLLAFAAAEDDVVIAQATPLGGERRWASADGHAELIEGDSVANDVNMLLEPMVPNTAYVDVAALTGNLNLGVLTSTDPILLNTTIWALRKLQESVIDLLPGLDLGVPHHRHEPPRRFRVTGQYIRPGARLVLTMTDAVGADPLEMEMDLYPALDGEGELVWETFVELDALHTLALLNGGFQNDAVREVMLRTNTAAALDPTNDNQFEIRVENEDGTVIANPDLQILKVQDDRS